MDKGKGKRGDAKFLCETFMPAVSRFYVCKITPKGVTLKGVMQEVTFKKRITYKVKAVKFFYNSGIYQTC